jgi:hypothetical protein
VVSGNCLITLLAYHLDCNKSNTTGVTSGTGTTYPSSAHEFTPVFSGVRVTRFIASCVCFVDGCFCFLLCFLYFMSSVVLRYTDSDYPFGIFKLFFDASSDCQM